MTIGHIIDFWNEKSGFWTPTGRSYPTVVDFSVEVGQRQTPGSSDLMRRFPRPCWALNWLSCCSHSRWVYSGEHLRVFFSNSCLSPIYCSRRATSTLESTFPPLNIAFVSHRFFIGESYGWFRQTQQMGNLTWMVCWTTQDNYKSRTVNVCGTLQPSSSFTTN